MRVYNWQQEGWPQFRYNPEILKDALFAFAERNGLITGAWLAMPADTRQDVVVGMLAAEAIKTSEIEGELLIREDVFSSIRKNLGLHVDNRRIKDRRAVGIAEMMTDARKTWQEPLTQEKLFAWHEMLLGGSHGMHIGGWRIHEEPMQVVSGAMGREKVHFEAPPSSQVPEEMRRFIQWFNDKNGMNGIGQAPVRCAFAHLYFESIHPFEDGNGRIGRAIAEKALSQGIGRPVLLCLSEQIQTEKKSYYAALKQAQRTLDVTEWVHYFVHTLLQALSRAEAIIDFTLRKARLFDRFRDRFNERQHLAIQRMLEQGPGGLHLGMSAGKYADLTQISKATATRDIQELVDLGVFVRLGHAGGRSTKYRVEV